MVRYLSITPLNNIDLTVTALVHTNKIGVRRIQFGDIAITHIWGFTINSATIYSEHSAVYVNDAQNKSFFLLSVYQSKLFLSVDPSGGAIISRYYLASFCNIYYSYNAVAVGNMLYMATR